LIPFVWLNTLAPQPDGNETSKTGLAHRSREVKWSAQMTADCGIGTMAVGTERHMNQQKRTCPACGGEDYQFRSRKQIEATPEQEAMLETKFRCRGCGEEWKEKVVGVLRKASPPK
jgi:DNA-directed RNA polymerase subunit M/transcription elongation factor TFIIS